VLLNKTTRQTITLKRATKMSSPTGWARLVSIDPDTGVTNRDWITKDGTLIFWIEAYDVRPGDEVVVSWTGGGTTGWHAAQYDAATNRWFYQMTTPLPAGQHTILTALRDGSDQRGGTSGQRIEILDPPPQMATIDSYVDNVGQAQGDFGNSVPTDDRTLTLKGTVRPEFFPVASGARAYYSLALYKDGVYLGEITKIDQATGTWEYELDISNPLEFIDHGEQGVFTIQTEDIAGGKSAFTPDFVVDVNLDVTVDFLTTSNHTPTLTGDFAFEVLTQKGEYVEVTVNGKTYSSTSGQVILDHATGKWQLQIPASDAIPTGTYDVVAILHRANGTTVVNDKTIDELTIIDLGPPPPPPPPTPPVNVGTGVGSMYEKYTAVTLNEQGQWSVATNGAIMDARAVDSYNLSHFEITRLAALDRFGGQNATFIDINRDGLMDVIINDADGGTGQQIFINQGNSRYSSQQIGAMGQNMGANVKVEYGGVIGFDKTGNGYVDIAYGDARPYGSGTNGWDSQVVINLDGNLTTMVKDRYFTDAQNGSNRQQSLNWGNAQAAPEISGVDLNNDGTVDLVFHANYRSSTVKQDNGRSMGSSSNAYRLVVASNNGDGSYRTSQVVDDVFQNNKYDNYGMANATAMTWADFDGDGYMDLFIGRGRAHNSKTGNFYGRPHVENESRILFNDGHGNLGSTRTDGVGKANDVYWMGDNLQGGASLAVDWNGDGKMDVIELPSFGDRNGVTLAGNTDSVNLYTNISSGGVVNFTTSNLLGGRETIGINGTVNTGPGKAKPTTRPTNESDFVTGAVLVDLDWNGSQDLMILTRMGSTQTIMNNNVIADGTALHLRIVDAEGVNSFFGNTVQLVDSTGRVVAVQVINPQSGNQTNDSTGLVHFYGLDPNETYSAVLLRNVNGSSADVGGIAQIGGNVIENVNASWGGLKAGKPYEAHILTAESDTNIANANIGKGIIGTGYNDTFYASKGTDSYDGAGGTTFVQGVRQWSSTGGIDIIDFKLAGNQSVTVDLFLTSYQNTGFNTVRLVNIEGVSGGNGDDYFIGNAQDNLFNGRGGDDHFYLSDGGHDTLVYQLIDSTDSTGGNGYDRVYDFTVGDVLRNADADLIDLSELLVGYQAGTSNLDDFVSVRRSGNDTILSVDLDGAAGGHGFADMIIFTDRSFDLSTLINNGQIIV